MTGLPAAGARGAGRARRRADRGGTVSGGAGNDGAVAGPALVRRTSVRLSDGRELFYFDDREPYLSGAATRDQRDARAQPQPVTASEIRLDVLTGEYVAIAAHRMDRTYLPPAGQNPLAPSRPGGPPTEIPADDYDVVVFENRFPTFSGGTGRCEVICFTSDPEQRLRHARRPAGPHRDRGVGGPDRGAVRVAGYPPGGPVREPGRGDRCHAHPPARPDLRLPVPAAPDPGAPPAGAGAPRAHRALPAGRRAGRRTAGGAADGAAGRRALECLHVPLARSGRSSLHLAPHRDVADLAGLAEPERAELAEVYLELLGRVDRFFPGVDRTPYIAVWHQAPVGPDRELGRLHLQLFSVMRAPGRLKFLAGSESGMGAWINDTTPERIAHRLREVAS